MAIDLLLVDPPTSQKKRYGSFALCGNRAPSYGLMHIASVARNEGFKTKILDMAVTEMDDSSFKQYLLTERPRILGVTAATLAVSDAARVCKIAKNTIPDILTVLGGHHISSVPEATLLRYPEFDIGVIGEGEMTMLDLLKLTNPLKDDFTTIKGLAFRNGNQVSLSEPRELIQDLNSLPLPAIDLLPDLKTNYIPTLFSVKRTPAVLLMTTRGCPGRCTFCTNVIHGRRIRQFSVDYLFELIYLLTRQYGIKELQIFDDTFTANRNRVIEFCERLIREDIDLTWSCLARVNGVNTEMLNLMKRAGCWQICYGVESGDEAMLKKIKKDISLDQVRKAIDLTKEAGICTKGFFIIGFPGETRESLKKTLDLALSLPLNDLALTIFTPYPGTQAYSDIINNRAEYGTFTGDWDSMTALNASFVAKGFTKDELIKINRDTYRNFYFRPRIFLSYLHRMSGWKFLVIVAKGAYGLLRPMFVKNKEF
jgi:radical SAM superfamily enzyme YgiQ (UPF0313 family)